MGRFVVIDAPTILLEGGVYLVWTVTKEQAAAALKAGESIMHNYVKSIDVLSHLQNMHRGFAAGRMYEYRPQDGDMGLACYKDGNAFAYRMFIYRVLRGKKKPVDTRNADPTEVVMREIGGESGLPF